MSGEDGIIFENLKKLGVYELRELARRSGVYSPTTKKANQLIDEIVKINSGELKAIVNLQKRGRPPKSLKLDDSKLTDIFIPKEIADIAEKSKQKDEDEFIGKFIFKCEETNFGFDSKIDRTIKVKGYARISSSEYFYFWAEKEGVFAKNIIVFVPEDLSKKYSSREGDLIDGKAILYKDKNCAVLTDIISINDNKVEANFKRKSLNEKDVIIPSDKLSVFNEEMFKGGRAVALFKDRSNSVLKILEESDKLLTDKFKVLFIGIELPPEFCAVLNTKLDLKKFFTRFGDGLECSYNIIINAINHIKSLAKDQNEIIVFVYDIIGLYDILNLYFSSSDDSKMKGLQLVKNLFGLGKCIEGGSSITIVATGLIEEENNAFIGKELLKVASCVIRED